jgi:hypothetical protein
MERVIRNSAPQDNHSYCRLFKELRLEMTGYGPLLFGNRLVRTRMLGGVGAGGEKPLATRLFELFMTLLGLVKSRG